MKKIIVIALFLAAFMGSYCFAANPIEKQHKGHHYEAIKDETIDTSTALSVNGERPSASLRTALSERSESNGRSRIIELSGKLEDEIRVIEVRALRYKFEPDPIVVKLGERVRLVVRSSDVTHGLSIDEFKVKLSIPPGKIESVEFVADKKGTFHAYCSVYCGPGHSHMHASFIVK